MSVIQDQIEEEKLLRQKIEDQLGRDLSRGEISQKTYDKAMRRLNNRCNTMHALQQMARDWFVNA